MAGRITDEMILLMEKAGSNDYAVASAAMREFAKALELPLRKGLMAGDIVGDIYEYEVFKPGVSIEYPLDFLAPGTQKDYVAYTIPNAGFIPQKAIEGDYLMVPTYDVGASIDWNLKYMRDARWDIASRAMNVMESQFVKKFNDDGWHAILAAAADRNLIVFDSDAGSGQFTKRLISLTKTIMSRQGGGNATTLNKAKLTDLYISPENMEDIRNWGVDIIDEFTRREIFQADDGTFSRIFSVNLHPIYEFGEGQEYQQFYLQALQATLPNGKLELIVGLDLEHTDSFLMPVRQEVEIFEDTQLHRQRKAGLYGWAELGFAVADGRRVILAAA